MYTKICTATMMYFIIYLTAGGAEFVEIWKGSKYVYDRASPTFERENVTKACNDAQYDLPSIDHIADWRSLNEYIPQLAGKGIGKGVYAIQSHYNSTAGWWSTVTKKASFLNWMTDGGIGTWCAPDNGLDKDFLQAGLFVYEILTKRKDGKKKWYAAADNMRMGDPQPLHVVCQKRLDESTTPKLSDTKEEKEYQKLQLEGKIGTLFFIGETTTKDFMISSEPRTWEDAQKVCGDFVPKEGERFKMFGEDERTEWNIASQSSDAVDTTVHLRAILGNHFRKEKLHPLSSFWLSENTFGYFINGKGLETHAEIKSFKFLHTSMRLFVLCYRKNPVSGDCDCN